MKRALAAVVLVLVTALIILFGFAPDVLSLAILGIMTLVTIWGYIFGIFPLIHFWGGFRSGVDRIKRVDEVHGKAAWISIQQIDSLFHQKTLDLMFEEYMAKAKTQETEDRVISDIEEVINEDSLSLRSWDNVVSQIPGTLTALGLLGTFIGLILGINTIAFSSVEATLSSIELLLTGIRTAFYTSIAGVILSIIFNLIHKLSWNAMIRELGMFIEEFHMLVFPDVEEQQRNRSEDYLQKILEKLDRLPEEDQLTALSPAKAMMPADLSNEQKMMPDIRRGLAGGEFTFYIQPRYELATKKIVGGEALVRWEHAEMGMIYPAAFMGVLERNGFVVRLDKYMWEEVCKVIARWTQAGIRPVPISVNVTKTDIMAMDVAQVLSELVEKYDISPRCLEVEIDETAYLESEDSAREVEEALRNRGFRVIIDGFDEEFLAMSVMHSSKADALKMDLRYMGTMSDKRESAVDTMMEEARKLRMPIMAKCIENAQQLSDLRRSGCGEGQGNFLKKPVSIEEFEHLTEYANELEK